MKETHKVHSYSSESAKCTENLSAVRICLVNPLRPKLLIEFFYLKNPHILSVASAKLSHQNEKLVL